MLTRKELLLKGIKIPEENKQNEMALPPSSNEQAVVKKHGLLSTALFKESLHSNRLSLFIVSFGNAIIMCIIIAILSTLHINATSSALEDLFSNSDTETTIKSSAISLYSSYSSTAEAYHSFVTSDDQVLELINTDIEEVNDSTLNTTVATARIAYDVAYRFASGTETEKNASAKSSTMTVVENALNNTSISETEKKTAKSIISYYFDIYATNKSATTQSILVKAVPMAIYDTAVEEMVLNDDQKEALSTALNNATDQVYNQGKTQSDVAYQTSFDLIPALADEDSKEFVTELVSGLSRLYETDSSAYIKDVSIRNDYVDKGCQSYIMDMLEEYSYYQYLPDFTLQYKTNDLGYPVHLVGSGRYADNGDEIMVEEAVTEYDPDSYISISEKMGTKANLLHKMHKYLLTGEEYTEQEIQDAKKEAKENIATLKTTLSEFMTKFRSDTSAYCVDNEIDDSIIQNAAVEKTVALATEEVIDQFNEKNGTNITSIEEITIENASMSGAQMVNSIQTYAASGISSFNIYKKKASDKGYGTMDALLVGMTKGSEGVMSSLPVSVDDSLSEMASMNTYGIIVGVVAFGIANLLIPMVYTILLAKSLISEKVETGSLAFTLSTPTTRRSYIITEAVYLLFSETFMALVLLGMTLAVRTIGIQAGSEDIASSLPVSDIMLYALGNYMVTLAVSGICFLSSCHFNKTNQAIGTGGGLTIFFFICSILGLFGTKAIPGTIRISMMNIFNYMTIDSLFDAVSVMEGNYGIYALKLCGLLAITVVTYILGAINFEKKDLPL